MPAQSLAGRSALVTGGARRLGRAIALKLAEAGADVAITYRNSRREAEETVEALKAMGRCGLAVACDVRLEDSARGAVTSVADYFGRLDLLVNNAGVFESASLDALSLESWDQVFATNTRGPFLMAREAHPLLQTSNGSIVNIGSLGGLRAWPGHAHYCASKAALHMLTQAMARAFAPAVRVNCVAPGWIEMEETVDGSPTAAAEMARHFAAKTPLQHNGCAEDVAEAVLFFAAQASFITGQILAVDGGLGLV